MKTTTAARAVTDVLFGLTIAGAPKLALADIKDYELQLVEPPVRAGAKRLASPAQPAVRLQQLYRRHAHSQCAHTIFAGV